MTLLQQIQNDAVDGKTDLATLLRKCRVLAARLKNDEFKNWVQYELDGYPNSAVLPDYRQFICHAFGHFSGPFGSGIKNAPLAIARLPEELREIAMKTRFGQGVGALQNIVAQYPSVVEEQWPADLVALVASRFYENMVLLQAWKAIPASRIVGILDTVRNRILNFVLEIEAESPSAGEGIATPSLTTEKVSTVFNTYIMGNVGNVAAGSSNVQQQAAITVSQGDWDSLERYLRTLAVKDEDIKDLKDQVDADPTNPKKSFGKRVAGWIGKMIAKSAQGLWDVGTNVATSLLTKALSQYYGLPNP